MSCNKINDVCQSAVTKWPLPRRACHILNLQTLHKLSARSLLPHPNIFNKRNVLFRYAPCGKPTAPLPLVDSLLDIHPPAPSALNFSCMLVIKIRFSQCHSHTLSRSGIANENTTSHGFPSFSMWKSNAHRVRIPTTASRFSHCCPYWGDLLRLLCARKRIP